MADSVTRRGSLRNSAFFGAAVVASACAPMSPSAPAPATRAPTTVAPQAVATLAPTVRANAPTPGPGASSATAIAGSRAAAPVRFAGVVLPSYRASLSGWSAERRLEEVSPTAAAMGSMFAFRGGARKPIARHADYVGRN